MGLLKAPAKKPPLRLGGSGATQVSSLRPVQLEKLAPCIDRCPSGNDIRGWLTTIALREKLGYGLEEAYTRAWGLEVDTNPFPAIMGRVCPHPCESHCNRKEKDEAVAINSVERVIGDWGISQNLPLPKMDVGGPFAEKIAVIGAGPAGLSCAYQLARRGYRVTVLESLPHVGGMLRYGIPEYRLPRNVIDAEVQKIADLGVDIRCNVKVGKDVTFAELRRDYAAIFVGIGAHQGKALGVPGETGPGVWTGTEFLNHVNAGKRVELGGNVVVIGGGDTAIDAARVSKRVAMDAASMSKRLGSDVTILYRRTRTEMPAIEREIDEALEEDIRIEYLTAPKEILRNDDGTVRAMVVQRMRLGDPDASGRRAPVPVEGDTYELAVATIITAVSQEPDMAALGAAELTKKWLTADPWGRTEVPGVWTGGDNIGLGLATISIGQGRKAAESIHAALRGVEPKPAPPMPIVGPEKIKMEHYETKPRAQRAVLSPAERLARPMDEIDHGITADQALVEVTRCFSCGKCFGCEKCWMYCQASCFVKVADPQHGHYYKIKLEVCDGCKKCAEECPCGFLEMA
jgi:NADPH-dependent glutamate synthase beta subunit-like oxidoreductase/Pyruvate/2-oxoacid:ferredoxin oxidoreductase delta subunit